MSHMLPRMLCCVCALPRLLSATCVLRYARSAMPAVCHICSLPHVLWEAERERGPLVNLGLYFSCIL